MSPEQVRGQAADARSDIFSFGAILYEMLSGSRAFQGDTAADTMSAILKEDPPELSDDEPAHPARPRTDRPPLPREESRAALPLGARPRVRPRSALRHVRAGGRVSANGRLGRARPRAPRRLRHPRRGDPRARLLGRQQRAAHGLAAGAGRSRRPSTCADLPSRQRALRPLHRRCPRRSSTARRGQTGRRRSSSRASEAPRRALGIPGASLLSVSPTGELAILFKKTSLFGTAGEGTLARVPLAGARRAELLENVLAADWAPDGKNLAVIRRRRGTPVLEYPIGKRCARRRASGTHAFPRRHARRRRPTPTSPDLDRARSTARRPERSSHELRLRGHDRLAPVGREIWFMAVESATGTGIAPWTCRATCERSPPRPISRFSTTSRRTEACWPSASSLGEIRFASAGGGPSATSPGSTGRSSRPVRRCQKRAHLGTGESEEARRIGLPARHRRLPRACDWATAVAQDISPDGKWALTLVRRNSSTRLVLLPTAAGRARDGRCRQPAGASAAVHPARRQEDRVRASEAGHGVRGYVLDLAGGPPRAFTRGGAHATREPSRRMEALRPVGPDRRPRIYPVDGGDPRRSLASRSTTLRSNGAPTAGPSS